MIKQVGKISVEMLVAITDDHYGTDKELSDLALKDLQLAHNLL